MAPMIKAEEADGMFLFLTGDSLTLKILQLFLDSSGVETEGKIKRTSD